MGVLILLFLAAVEAAFLIWNLSTKTDHTAEKAVVNLAAAAVFLVLCLTGIVEWGFRYYLLAVVLAVCAILGGVALLRKKQKAYRGGICIARAVGKALLLAAVIFPAILFPQYKQIAPTGEYTVAEKSYVFTDESRTDPYSESGEKRRVTVVVYYPENASGTYPLAVFSHGAFGFYDSNFSTFEELASNGYIVASINHPHHAFFDTEAYGHLVTVDPDIIQKTTSFDGKDETDEEFTLSHEWLALRTADMNFVIDTLKAQAQDGADPVLSHIDTDKLGVFGHSLGGAASVELGRERSDISAVIDIDGTMIGEELDFKDGKVINNTAPYPVPMLDIFGQNHYDGAQKYADEYPNLLITKTSDNVQNVVLKNSGHMNLTDLVMFSPALAKYLGTGTVDSRTCLTTMNGIIRSYFDWKLKGAPDPQLKGAY
jgi:dienelactone hydrolase